MTHSLEDRKTRTFVLSVDLEQVGVSRESKAKFTSQSEATHHLISCVVFSCVYVVVGQFHLLFSNF